MKIFISHISEEALFALLLKDFIESTFLGQCEVSLSSNAGHSEASATWLEELDDTLTSTELLFVLCSSKSIRQPWVHFEFGSAWTRKIPITCICHSGQSKSGLPAHLRTFSSFDADDHDFMEQLLNGLATLLGIERLPRLSYDTMKAEMRATLASITPEAYSDDAAAVAEEVKPKEEDPKEEEKAVLKPAPPEYQKKEEEREKKTKPPKPKPKPKSPPKAVVVKKKAEKKNSAEPESVQTRILKMLAAGGITGYALDDLSDLLAIGVPRLEPYLDALREQGYLDISYGAGGPPEYTIAAKGEKFLKESKPTQ